MKYANLAIAAEKSAEDSIIIDSYKSLFTGSGFYLTKNRDIVGSKRRPPKFPSTADDLIKNWNDKNRFVYTQRRYLLYLAGLNDKKVIKANYMNIKEAYDKWNKDYYVVVLGGEKQWACSLFVGEALYMMNKKELNGDGKYFSAKEIWENRLGLTLVDESKDVQPGNIVAFDGIHVEIVMEVNQGKKSFCSRGTGRTAVEEGGRIVGVDFGTKRCGDDRKLDDPTIKFFKI